MLDSFLRTLWIKLHKRNNKNHKFKLLTEVTSKNFKEYRENQNKILKSSSFN
jgi:hypothetical protein